MDTPTNYLNILKNKPLKKIEMHASARGQALIDQKHKCARCKKDLNLSYCKYIQDPSTKRYSVLCADCAIQSGKR